MKIKVLLDEDFIQYKKPSMFIGTCYCDWKCCKDYGDITMCQNSELAEINIIIDISDYELIRRYLINDITEAVVFGGLEPMKQYEELYNFIKTFREYSDDDIVIYTGYTKEEIKDYVQELKKFKNLIIKFGRFIPNDIVRYDENLGVYLASSNQYAEKIS